MIKKTNFVIVITIEMILCLNPLWTSNPKVVLRRKRWYNSSWKETRRPNDLQPPW